MAKRHVILQFALALVVFYCSNRAASRERAKDNGDIYVQLKEQPALAVKASTGMETKTSDSTIVNVEEVMKICNASFSIPMEYIVKFNKTGDLSETTDKTGMCFIRCFVEKAGLINDWQLNKNLIMQIMWPMTADSVEFCESEAKSEVNACVRTYAIAKCLKKRAFEDARNETNVKR